MPKSKRRKSGRQQNAKPRPMSPRPISVAPRPSEIPRPTMTTAKRPTVTALLSNRLILAVVAAVVIIVAALAVYFLVYRPTHAVSARAVGLVRPASADSRQVFPNILLLK